MSATIPANTLEKFTTFGDLLRFLRRRAGITQTELSIAVGYSTSQISRLEQNLRLPDLPTLRARFVEPLDLTDDAMAVSRLLELAADVRREDAPAAGLCPYKGLNYFDEVDADLFVGREVLTARLAERVLALSRTDSRFLAIVGASGSGKSSLVRAGLVPALRWNTASTGWHIRVLTPTARPLESLAASLTSESDSLVATATLMDDLAADRRSLHLFSNRRSPSQNSYHLLLVIDQFEELFALCRSEEERSAFIGNLLTAASKPDGSTVVVIALRADFYAHCASYPELRGALAAHQEYIGAMTSEELRRAIEEPARRGHWELREGLVQQLLQDVGHEPGALPLLSHALLETWERRRGRMMTLSGYAASGGVRGAIAETAEAVFKDQFDDRQQAIARRIFLRLTELGDETTTGDTRRRATYDELILKPEEAPSTQTVLKALADARLIITSEDSAEVAHEALIREWPTLRGWLEDNREGLRLHRHLTEAAQEWQALERSTDMLYHGTRLAQAQDWAAINADDVNSLERQFLDASIAQREHDLQEREAQQKRELEAAQKLAEAEKERAKQQARAATQLRRRAIYLSVVLGVALVAALAAGIFAKRAVSDFALAEAQRLAAEANTVMLKNGDPNLVALLAIRSLTTQYTPSGDAVLTSLTLETPPREFIGHTSHVWAVAFSPDSKYLLTGSRDRSARLWDVATGKTIRIFPGLDNEVGRVAYSPDGKYIATTGGFMAEHSDDVVRLWDVASGELVRVFSGHTVIVNSMAFSPDGKYLVTGAGGGPDKTVRIWDVATGQTLRILSDTTMDGVIDVSFSPDGKYVLTASEGDHPAARIWDAATGTVIQVFLGHTRGVNAAAFSPDEKYIATCSDDGTARLWDAATGKEIREFPDPHQGIVINVRFSPDGRFLLTSHEDNTARLWDVATGENVRVFSGTQIVIQDVAFSPDGSLVAVAGGDGIARVWSLRPSTVGVQFIGHTGPVYQASLSPDGKQVVTASGDHTARIWDAASGQLLMVLAGHTDEVRGAVFSPDGKLVLTTSADHTARLWDASTGKELRQFVGHTDLVNQGAFSPDGKYIVTTSYDGSARVWDIQTGRTILNHRTQGPMNVNRVAFSPDGKTVATTGDDHTIRIWDLLSGKDVMIFKEDSVASVGPAGVAFSPDGRYIVTSSWDGIVRLWEVATGKEVHRFIADSGPAFGAAFSPDGKYVLSGGNDWTARLWDLQTDQQVRLYAGHTDGVHSVVFSPDGKYILTGSTDGTARLLPTGFQDAMRAVCALLTRDFTNAERKLYNIMDKTPTCSKP